MTVQTNLREQHIENLKFIRSDYDDDQWGQALDFALAALAPPSGDGVECMVRDLIERLAQLKKISPDNYSSLLTTLTCDTPQSAPVDGLTFNTFRAANVARCVKWHPEGIASWSPSDWLTAVTGELGELASLLKMRNRERDGLPGNKFSPTDKMVADELADVLTYLDLLAAVLGVDLGRAAVEKFNEVSERVGFPDRINVPTTTSPPASQEKEGKFRKAWYAVCTVLDEVSPGWLAVNADVTATDLACTAIRELASPPSSAAEGGVTAGGTSTGDDELPGMWSPSDLTGGATDAAEQDSIAAEEVLMTAREIREANAAGAGIELITEAEEQRRAAEQAKPDGVWVGVDLAAEDADETVYRCPCGYVGLHIVHECLPDVAEQAQAGELPEPVAVVGPSWLIAWTGDGPIAPLVRAHGLKIGDGLYTADQMRDYANACRLAGGVTDEMVERLAKYIYQQEARKCSTLDAYLHHMKGWPRALPEARAMLVAALGAK